MLNIFRYKRGRQYMTGSSKKSEMFQPRKSKRLPGKKRRKKHRRQILQRIDARRARREVTRRRKRKRMNYAFMKMAGR